MPTLLITGANRGIGLEFAHQYSSAGWDVVATARNRSPELDRLGVKVEQLDLSDSDGVAALPGRIDGLFDLFIANAGTNHPVKTDGANHARDWQTMLMVNAIAPFQLGEALLSRMTRHGKMIAISSGMGSVGENSGGWIPYRTSKAALNMAWSSLALEARERGIACVLISPGWVKTRMGGSGAEITAEESVSDMRRLIERIGIEDSGRFLRRNGSELPW